MCWRSIKSLLLDKELRGLWISLGAHGLVLLIVFIGLEVSSPEVHISPINAVQAVAIDNRSENRKRLAEQKQAQLKKEKAKKAAEEKRKQDRAKQAEQKKLKQDKAKQEQAKQEKLKQEKLKQDKAKQQQAAAVKRKKAAEAKKREADKKLAEQKRTAEAQRKQAEAQEFERRQQEEQRLLDEEKRQEKLRAEKAAKAAEARARQEDIDRAIYQQKISRFMTQHWIKPPNTKPGYVCEVLITQSRGGHVLDVVVVACNGDAAFRASVERAAKKPDQLPLPRNPAVFESKVRILFEEK